VQQEKRSGTQPPAYQPLPAAAYFWLLPGDYTLVPKGLSVDLANRLLRVESSPGCLFGLQEV
jgi:hypothetical protein